MALVELQVIEADTLVLAAADKLVLNLALLQLRDVASEVAKVDVLSTLLRFEELESYFSFRILVGHFASE